MSFVSGSQPIADDTESLSPFRLNAGPGQGDQAAGLGPKAFGLAGWF